MITRADVSIINGIRYVIDKDKKEATVVEYYHWQEGYVKYSGDIIIPNDFYYLGDNYIVTKIGYEAFKDCVDMTSLTIGDNVTQIDSYAFSGCSGLTSLVIGNGLTSISSDYFSECTSLNTLVVGCNVATIEDEAFKNCHLTDVTINSSSLVENTGNKTDYGYTYNSFCNIFGDDVTHYTIGQGVENIGIGAFAYCEKMTTITIPNSVTTIRKIAFNGCKTLNSIHFSDNLTTIEEFAFENCNSLTTISIPSSVVSIEEGAFGAEKIYRIIVESGNPVYDSREDCNAIIETSTNTLIAGCYTTTIPSSVTAIGDYAFQYSRNMTYIGIPNSITSIGNYAFAACSGLTSISIPQSVKSIGYYAFAVCKKLTSIEIPYGVTDIKDRTFWHCDELTSVVLPSSITSISLGAFFDCDKLTSLTVGMRKPLSAESLSYLGYYSNTGITLYVPKYSKLSYEKATFWKDFKEIIELEGDDYTSISIGSNGIATYSNEIGLNFTSVSGLKAYIASGFNPATGDLTMTRVYEVPAGEGLILKGAADSYEVPYEETSAYYANLLVGVPTATTVSPTDGDYTNFILSNDEVKGIGFYPLASAGEIGANKAYLQLPTSILPAASRSLRMVFEDEEDVTGINALNDKEKMMNDKAVYDLQGRRVSKPTRGLYIKDGKKIMVK